MSQKGFSVILIILGIVALVVGLFLVFKGTNIFLRRAQQVTNIISHVAGPNCPDGPVFNTIPIDPAKILSLTPLGNLNPPDHTIPTDHIYLVLKENNEVHPEFATKVFSPSDMIISRITHTTTKKSGKEFSNDYAIDFSPCKDVKSKFGHVTKISDKLKNVIDKNKEDCQTQYPRPEDEYTYCNFELNEKIHAEEELGEAGGGTPTGLDFWAIDFRSKELSYANPKRYSLHQLHTVCPIDLFEKTQKDILSSKFGRYEKKRTTEPLCGQLNQDVSGTAQGNWTTTDGYIDMPEAWSKSLALVHDNVDPTMGIVSIGGTIGNPAKIQFNPTSSSNINREFSQVKDNQIYCYEGQSIGLRAEASGRVLIQLINETTLKAEYQSKSCSDDVGFANPTTYQR